MLLLTSSLFDVLKPIPGKKIKYYDLFISQYTLVTTSTVVAQCNLMPEMFGETTEVLDSHVDRFIAGIPDQSKEIRETYGIYSRAAGVNPGIVAQESEARVFISSEFEAESKKYGMSNRELVISSLNASAFLQYFFLFENSLVKMYQSKYQPREESQAKLSAKDVIAKCLKGKVMHDDVEELFFKNLKKRSKFFENFSQLESVWKLLNFIRNRQVHYGGKYEGRAPAAFEGHVERICESYRDAADMTLSVVLLLNVLEPLQEQVRKHGYMVFNDSLENLMRNYSLFVMESLYLTEK
ncbi:hypothetical protein GTP46_26950 [Duganella sp. FT135W]|uniref:Uncharacterized protein n=1 Tax=Duganella flavida TaxID=2692175 RepID=A0A6L8KKM1_9BURK|nr:hypothetical protein [Duganella flavida]MYM26274.1 hypothetical protein [Duganella flavida]